MEGNGNQDGLGIGRNEGRHIMRHRPGDRDLAAVFQADREAARQIVIGHRRAASGDPRRPGEAARAMALLGRLQW